MLNKIKEGGFGLSEGAEWVPDEVDVIAGAVVGEIDEA